MSKLSRKGLSIPNAWRNCGLLLLAGLFHFPAAGQPISDKDAKYVISGTGIFGGYGLFAAPTADILPKGRFATGATYESASANRAANLRYSLGFGLASRAEAFVAFSNALGNSKRELSQAALKINVSRGDLREDFLGSVELGYMQTDLENNGAQASFQTLLGRLQTGFLFGDLEVTGTLGYALQLDRSAASNRILIGVAAFTPFIRNFTVGAELSSDYSAASSDKLGFATGAKVNLFDHFQVTIAGRSNLRGPGLAPTLMIGLSFSSAFFHIAPERKRSFSRVPPLPTLEELEKPENQGS